MEFTEQLKDFLNKLNGSGVFLTAGEKPNTMTASWGFCGVMWNKPIVVMPVRTSRYTHGLIKDSGEFSVSVPMDASFNKLLGYFGSVSGRDTDKYGEQNIKMVKCSEINTFVFPGKCMNFECKLIFANTLNGISSEIKDRFYGDNSLHTMFYGEIIKAYEGK